jgi:hypothetical protein
MHDPTLQDDSELGGRFWLPWAPTDIPFAPEAGLVLGLLAGWLAAGGLFR